MIFDSHKKEISHFFIIYDTSYIISNLFHPSLEVNKWLIALFFTKFKPFLTFVFRKNVVQYKRHFFIIPWWNENFFNQLFAFHPRYFHNFNCFIFHLNIKNQCSTFIFVLQLVPRDLCAEHSSKNFGVPKKRTLPRV